MATGIFTPPGIVIFFFLYLTLFHLFDSIIARYHLVVYQVILVTFALYSVLLTGLLHKELTEFVTQPGPITPLIRIQASFFVAFAFYLLNNLIPRDETKVLSIKQASVFFATFVLVLSTTGAWRLPSVILAFKWSQGYLFCLALQLLGQYGSSYPKKLSQPNIKAKNLLYLFIFILLLVQYQI